MDNNLIRKIAIIGVGQLGSRHLQALALIKERMKIYMIDPYEKSLKVSKERFQEVNGDDVHTCEYHRSIDTIKEDSLDLIIVATNAGIRSRIIQQVLENWRVEYLILEKFLFQTEKEYSDISSLIEEKQVKVFVNCPRRIFNSYIKIKDTLRKYHIDSAQMEIVGSEWGLGCNGIHFIDLFHFLTGIIIEDWTNLLDEGHIESKRQGNVEFTGRIIGLNGKYLVSITSLSEIAPNVSVRFSTPSIRFIINEAIGKIWIERLENGSWILDEDVFEMQYQSSLTNVVVSDLFNTNNCKLTPFKESVSMHIPFLKVLLSHYNSNKDQNSEICPIT